MPQKNATATKTGTQEAWTDPTKKSHTRQLKSYLRATATVYVLGMPILVVKVGVLRAGKTKTDLAKAQRRRLSKQIGAFAWVFTPRSQQP